MGNLKYKSSEILYLPERDMFSGVILLKSEESFSSPSRYWYRHYWVWWANTGKTISVKKHPYNTWTMQKFVNQKVSNKYQKVDEAFLLERWPNFYDNLECRMLFEVFKND